MLADSDLEFDDDFIDIDESNKVVDSREPGNTNISALRLTRSADSRGSFVSNYDRTLHNEVHNWSLFRYYIYLLVESSLFSAFILLTIFANVAAITMQINKVLVFRFGWYFSVIDNVFLGIYQTELLMKMYVWRIHFFRNGWNMFDLFVVSTSTLEVWSMMFIGSLGGIDPKVLRLLRIFRTLRAIRALRVLRTITFLRSLQVIATTLLRSLPAMSNIFALIALVTYVFAIIGVSLYRDTLPECFADLPTACFTLFQIMTLDDWFTIYDRGRNASPYMIFYLAAAVITETFILVNLLIAVIVSNLENSHYVLTKEKMLAQKLRQHRLERQHDIDRFSQAKIGNSPLTNPSLGSPSELKVAPDTMRRKKLTSMAIMLQSALESQIGQFQGLEQVHDDLCSTLLEHAEDSTDHKEN
uniref:Ion transport domain-containing protein n=1 Tax=Spongospora subterranea TaxID=70186 RepID=A0A0H5RBA3_9EUKA|eukprot:CRZ11298.1 hypothetical protein [Spongospora subterranea]